MDSMSVVKAFLALSDEEKDEVKHALFLSDNSDFDLILAHARKGIVCLDEVGGKYLCGPLGMAYDCLTEIEHSACK